jgi:hypothetical protein
MGDVLIEVRALRKLFDGFAAVDGLDLRVVAEVFADSWEEMTPVRAQQYGCCWDF